MRDPEGLDGERIETESNERDTLKEGSFMGLMRSQVFSFIKR